MTTEFTIYNYTVEQSLLKTRTVLLHLPYIVPYCDYAILCKMRPLRCRCYPTFIYCNQVSRIRNSLPPCLSCYRWRGEYLRALARIECSCLERKRRIRFRYKTHTFYNPLVKAKGTLQWIQIMSQQMKHCLPQ